MDFMDNEVIRLDLNTGLDNDAQIMKGVYKVNLQDFNV